MPAPPLIWIRKQGREVKWRENSERFVLSWEPGALCVAQPLERWVGGYLQACTSPRAVGNRRGPSEATGLTSLPRDAQARGRGDRAAPGSSVGWRCVEGPVAVTTAPAPDPGPPEQPCSRPPPVRTEGWINFPVSLILSSFKHTNICLVEGHPAPRAAFQPDAF